MSALSAQYIKKPGTNEFINTYNNDFIAHSFEQ